MKTTFKEYAKLNKDAYEALLHKMSTQSVDTRYGTRLEDLFHDLCTESGYKISRASMIEDLLLGYDFKISWVHEGKHYSAMIDVTARDKQGVDYYTYEGQVKSRFKSMFGGSFISSYIGIKTKHTHRFSYKTPVYVFQLKSQWVDLPRYKKQFEFIMESFMHFHMTSGRPQRASQNIFLL